MRIEEGTLTTEYSLKGITVTFITRDFDAVNAFMAVADKKPMQAEIKAVRQKRSLDANAYYWVLLGKLQRVLGLSSTEAHNMILEKYGVIFPDQFVLLPEDVDYLKQEIHYRPIPNKIVEKNGKTWKAYWIVKPSHLYDTKEFSALLDGLISDCQECGIETLTPEELERMKNYEKVLNQPV
jgi:hypothetical protein